MTTRQGLEIILCDLKGNIAMGMSRTQAEAILMDQLIDFVEWERERMFKMGEKAGRLSMKHESLFTNADKPAHTANSK